MVDASEFLDSPTPMATDLLQGMRAVALDQRVKFRLYGRVVLPADGYVFWVRAPLLKQKAFQPSGLVTAAELSDEEMKACELEPQVSLHVSTDFRQEEAENYAANRVVLTTRAQVRAFEEVAPGTMWIGQHGGLRFGFSSQAMRYSQAGLWHYAGFALYADMATQVVDRAQDFSPDLVVSNSLPAWLAVAQHRPQWAFWQPLPALFPSMLAPDNEPPPFGTVHVVPELTQALASAPTVDQATQSHTQLCRDTVRVTLWGQRNLNAMDFVDAVYDYSSTVGAIGIMNVPTVRDEKRTQAEMRTIAQKKTIEFEVSYLQHAMRAVARQVIKSTVPALYVNDVRLKA